MAEDGGNRVEQRRSFTSSRRPNRGSWIAKFLLDEQMKRADLVGKFRGGNFIVGAGGAKKPGGNGFGGTELAGWIYRAAFVDQDIQAGKDIFSAEEGDFLRAAVFENCEVVGRKISQVVSLIIGDMNSEGLEIYLNAKDGRRGALRE